MYDLWLQREVEDSKYDLLLVASVMGIKTPSALEALVLMGWKYYREIKEDTVALICLEAQL